MKRILFLCILPFLLSHASVDGIDLKASDYGVFVPDPLRFRDGNTNSLQPFLDDFGVNGFVRYQQVFASSAFNGLPPGGAYITTIIIRTDCVATSWTADFVTTNFDIWFSTTPKGPDQLSPRFAENIGPDAVQVRSRKTVFAIGNTGCPNPGPAFPYGPRIDLDVPFAYDPAKGHLLMETHVQGIGVPRTRIVVDAENVPGDPISRAVGRGFSAPSADIALDTIGIPVYFIFNGPPILSAQRTNTGIVLSWSSDPLGFKLQWADNVQSESAWKDYPEIIPPALSWVVVLIPKSQIGKTKYFRLINPTLPPLGQPAPPQNTPPPDPPLNNPQTSIPNVSP